MADFATRLGRKLLSRHSFQTRHAEPSMLFFAEPNDPSRPSPELMDLALAGIQAARQIDLADVSARLKSDINLLDIWPGEHYKLLGGFVSVLQPRLIVELGTATGSSALSLKRFQPKGARLVTFDVIPWQEYPGTVLTEADFADGTLQQYVDDISQPAQLTKHKSLLAEADLIFIDAAKDGMQEQLFLNNFEMVEFKKNPFLIFDDIRLWNMLRIWNDIRRPKLDITSFGHWSGTGLVQWGRSLD
jgi:predicted O-methyltransferase YrrM